MTFTADEERASAEFLLKAAKLHYGLSTKETRKLAYDYAISNGKHVPESWNDNRDDKEWLRDFMKRSGSLSLRTQEATSFSRATAWNRQTKNEFFTNIREARHVVITHHRIFTTLTKRPRLPLRGLRKSLLAEESNKLAA